MNENQQDSANSNARIQSAGARDFVSRALSGRFDLLTGLNSPHVYSLGFGLWIAACAIGAVQAGHVDWISIWMLMAPLLIAPLGWRLAVVSELVGDQPLFRIALRLWLAGSVPLALSFWFDSGVGAALLATPWLVVSGLVALAGLRGFVTSADRSLTRLITLAGLLMMPIGAGWAIASRGDLHPMGFPEPIVLLTGVHFHYAGFAAPLIAAAVGARLVGRYRKLVGIYRAASVGVVAGVLLLAAGFVVSPLLKLVAAVTLAMSLTVVAATQMVLAADQSSRWTKVLMVASSLAVVVGMGLAVVYAVGEYRGELLIDIPAMAVLHGLANGPGFALCGLAAWRTNTA